MTSDKGFKRCDGYVGSVPQNFINANLPVCPMCGDHEPYWLLKDKMEFTAHRILFRCSKCGCILSATQDDFTGTTKSTAYAVLTTGGAVNALIKHKQGKDVKTVYVKVEDAGEARISKELEGKELPLEDFQAMAAAFHQPAVPAAAPYVDPNAEDVTMRVSYGDATVAPQAPAYQPPQPAQEIPMQVSYAAPPQQAPAYQPQPAQEIPMQVSYQAPPAHQAPVYQAPVYQPQPAASEPAAQSFPIRPVIFAGIAAFLYFICLALPGKFPALTVMGNIFSILACAGVIVGSALRNNKNVSSIITAASFFVLALFYMIHLFQSRRFDALLINLTTMCTFGFAGVYHILKGKLFGNPLKMILCLVSLGTVFINFLVNVINGARFGYPASLVILFIFSAAADAMILLSAMFHNPYKGAK